MATKNNAAPAHDFGEKTQEWSAKAKAKLAVWQSPKYKDTKAKVIEMLDSGKYKGLTDGHFWILMNQAKVGGHDVMAYTGLIISHDGMKIINDNLPVEKKVKAGCFSIPVMSEYKKDCMYMYYQDEETMEFGEISVDNCKNSYPYAMLYKRCYDRVVKDKAKMYGVYSEAEADEFAQKIGDDDEEKEEKKETPKTKAPAQTQKQEAAQTLQQAANLYDGVDVYAATEKMYSFDTRKAILEHYGKDYWHELDFDLVTRYYEDGKKRLAEKKNENNK